jgi:hypothetical protein
MVKSSRCDVDPDWRFAVSATATNLPKSVKKDIVQAACNFLTIAISYRYSDGDGNDIDPVWEYQHPRPGCDHSESEYDCKPEHVVKPEDADELVDYIGAGQLIIIWMRDSHGPVLASDNALKWI